MTGWKAFAFSTLLCLFVLASCGSSDMGTPHKVRTLWSVGQPLLQRCSGRELFYSDSLNAFGLARTYPVPDVAYTQAPRGYKPVYVSSYARHGSRKLSSEFTVGYPVRVLSYADSIGCLTPLGEGVLCKLRLIEADMRNSLTDLTSAGVRQHRGIAERMCLNYPYVFSRKGVHVRLYSTPFQRTMLSMFACNEELLKHNRSILFSRQASSSLTYLRGEYDNPDKIGAGLNHSFVTDYFNPQPVLDRLFTGGVPVLRDTATFISGLYECGSFVSGLDIEDVDFIWDLFTMEELFILQQAKNYQMYVTRSNSPQLGDLALSAIRPLLRDFVDKADGALEQDVPCADLRFGHDIYLTQLVSLIGVNGYVPQEGDPLKVVDVFADFITSPMAGNLQMVFYRNRGGDVLVKFLQNEVESWIPIETDTYPYYHWNDVRDYFNSLIGVM